MIARIERLLVHPVRVPTLRTVVTAVGHTDSLDAVAGELVDCAMYDRAQRGRAS